MSTHFKPDACTACGRSRGQHEVRCPFARLTGEQIQEIEARASEAARALADPDLPRLDPAGPVFHLRSRQIADAARDAPVLVTEVRRLRAESRRLEKARSDLDERLVEAEAELQEARETLAEKAAELAKVRDVASWVGEYSTRLMRMLGIGPPT